MLALRPVTGTIGAVIGGIDLSEKVGVDLARVLRQALWDHHVLFFREQSLDIPDLKRVTRVFGALKTIPYIAPLLEDPEVIAVEKKATDRNVAVFGGQWHSDFSFLEHPPAGSLLSAINVPEVGGDTVWANQTLAFETLPDDLKVIIEGRAAIHTGKPYGVRFAPLEEERAVNDMVRNDPTADREIFHPVVRRHPENGLRSLFVNPIYTSRIEGYSEAESEPILNRLYWHATQPNFCCRHRWRNGDLVVWDNRSTLHFAVNDYDGNDRLLYRTTFADGLPPRG